MSALSVGQTIRYLREEKGMTLKELGIRSGMSASFLYQVENGRQGISENRLRQLADVPDAWNELFPPEPKGRMRIVSIPGEGLLSETVTEGVRPSRVATSFYQGSPAHAGIDRAETCNDARCACSVRCREDIAEGLFVDGLRWPDVTEGWRLWLCPVPVGVSAEGLGRH